MVDPDRRIDFESAKALRPGRDPALHSRGEVEHRILGKFKCFPIHDPGAGSLPNDRDHFFRKLLLRADGALFRVQKFRKHALAPRDPGRHTIRDTDLVERGHRYRLAGGQLQFDFCVGDAALREGNVVMADCTCVPALPGAGSPPATGEGRANAHEGQGRSLPLSAIPHTVAPSLQTDSPPSREKLRARHRRNPRWNMRT